MMQAQRCTSSIEHNPYDRNRCPNRKANKLKGCCEQRHTSTHNRGNHDGNKHKDTPAKISNGATTNKDTSTWYVCSSGSTSLARNIITMYA